MTDTGMWIAMDGSSINYGAIDPETDFYDPDGEPLFGDDDDPDSENYEGFTGNAGEWDNQPPLAGCRDG